MSVRIDGVKAPRLASVVLSFILRTKLSDQSSNKSGEPEGQFIRLFPIEHPTMNESPAWDNPTRLVGHVKIACLQWHYAKTHSRFDG